MRDCVEYSNPVFAVEIGEDRYRPLTFHSFEEREEWLLAYCNRKVRQFNGEKYYAEWIYKGKDKDDPERGLEAHVFTYDQFGKEVWYRRGLEDAIKVLYDHCIDYTSEEVFKKSTQSRVIRNIKAILNDEHFLEMLRDEGFIIRYSSGAMI